MSNVFNLTGMKYGELTAIERVASPTRRASWRFRCSCGREIVAEGYRVRRGKRVYCDKANHPRTPRASVQTPGRKLAYVSWGHMIDRCYNPAHERYRHYGGRGIAVCDSWRSFAAFLADMGERPEGLTLDRIDLDGPYSPSNCRWATDREQRRNKRSTRYVEYGGRRLPLIDLCRELGLSYSLVASRIYALGWPVERAISEPARAK